MKYRYMMSFHPVICDRFYLSHYPCQCTINVTDSQFCFQITFDDCCFLPRYKHCSKLLGQIWIIFLSIIIILDFCLYMVHWLIHWNFVNLRYICLYLRASFFCILISAYFLCLSWLLCFLFLCNENLDWEWNFWSQRFINHSMYVSNRIMLRLRLIFSNFPFIAPLT